MDFPIGDETKITGYHAHIYYDEDSRETAARLREQIWNTFSPVEMGRFRDKAVGPHPEPMFQVAFGNDLFPEIVPWLMYHRDGLTILVHPEAEDAYKDHMFYPLWLGGKLDLRGEFLRAGNRQA